MPTYTHGQRVCGQYPLDIGKRLSFPGDGYFPHVMLHFRWVTMHEQIMLILINLAVPLVPAGLTFSH